MALGEFEWGDLDWGNVPEWLAGLGSLSLVLAFLVFKRDRDNAERVQVDRLGVWATVNPERTPNSLDSQEIHEVTTWVRNGSELPVRVVRIGLLIYTRWTVNDPELYTWTVEPGIKPVPAFIGDLHVPPGETEEYKLAVSVADTAPEEAQSLDPDKGVTARVDRLLVVDNAGRRWDVHPEAGGRAKRISGLQRRKKSVPRQWE